MVLLDDRVALTLLKVTTVRIMPINIDLVPLIAALLAIETKWSVFCFALKTFNSAPETVAGLLFSLSLFLSPLLSLVFFCWARVEAHLIACRARFSC